MPYRRSKIFLLAATLCTFAFAAAAQTPEAGADRPREKPGSTVTASVPIDAQAPNARLAALVRYGGVLISQKGVSSILRIDTGVYCITPAAATGITPSRAIVTVSPEYYYSQLNEVMVQWASTRHGCGPSRIGVYTLADPNGDGIYTFSDLVGFSIVVP